MYCKSEILRLEPQNDIAVIASRSGNDNHASLLIAVLVIMVQFPRKGVPVPLGDILSREKDLQKPTYRHCILVRGVDFQACKARILDFFRHYQLVRYSYITVLENESVPASDPGFGDRLHKAILENRKILHELIEELQREGVRTLNNLEDIPQGYKTKMLHVITHLVDGFFGIDTSFYNFEEDSHWVTDDYRKKMALEPSFYWLLTVEARI